MSFQVDIKDPEMFKREVLEIPNTLQGVPLRFKHLKSRIETIFKKTSFSKKKKSYVSKAR
jgi:hypothetical protein